MFKSFQDTSALQQFHGFPNLNMQQATSAYGFSGVTFWLDAAYGLNTQTNLGAVSRWQARIGGIFEQETAASQPRLILNDANYNNLPSVEAQSNARFMDAAIGISFQPNITIAVISKLNSELAENHVITNALTGPTTMAAIIDGGSTSGFTGFGARIGAATPSLQGTTETTTARIKIITSTNVIVNGLNQATGSIGERIGILNRIFRLDSTTRQMIGSIAEIIAFGYSMTSDEAIALSNNINQKYALY